VELFDSVIGQCRGVPNARRMTDSELQVCRKVLLEGSVSSGSLSPSAKRALLSKGWLYQKKDDSLTFSNPMYQRTFFSTVYPVTRPDVLKHVDLPKTVMEALHRLDPTEFVHSESKGSKSAPLLERAWQVQFHRCMNEVIPSAQFVSADAGKIHHTEGYVDFFIDGELHWGVELIREGRDIQHHLNRFLPAPKNLSKEEIHKQQFARYVNLDCKSYMVIDFRKPNSNPNKKDENLWTIKYSQDFQTLTVYHNQDKPLTISLMSRKRAADITNMWL